MGKIKIGFVVLISLALVGLILGGVVTAKPENPKGEYVQDEIIVKFKGDVKPFRVIKVSEGKVGEKIKEYLKRADVEYVEPNYIAYALMTPNDPNYRYQWHLDNPVYGGIQIEEAWDVSTGAGVTVAVVDTGIRKGTDLANTCFVSGWDYVNNDSDPTDDNGHGTHVAGTVAQSTNNNVGVAGVAFDSCLMPVKVLNSRGSGTYTQVANGIYYAADNGAKVINLSLGGSSDSTTLKDAVAYAYNKGVTVIAAAGNENSTSILYPAAYDDYVIAVGATQYDETKAPYSNYGPSLDIVAPGGNNRLDQNKDGYADGVLQETFAISRGRITWGYYFFQGTSMAAPHVSGVAALIIANGTAATSDEVRAVLEGTAEDLGVSGRDNTYGWGLVDAVAALGYAPGLQPNKPPVANAGPDQNVADTDGTGTETVTLDGSGSYDLDGTVTAWKWTEGETVLGEAEVIIYDFAVGTHTVTLTVTDDDGATSSDETIITVTKNQPPVADAGPDQSAYLGEQVNFDGSSSSDPDGTIVSYSWDFDTNDGIQEDATGITTSHIYTVAGIYTVTLTITDDGGLTAQDTAQVTISEKPAVPTAYVNIDLSKQSVWKWWRATAEVTITETNDSGPAVANATVEGTWSGVYTGTVSGTTDADGKVSFRTSFIREPGTVTFTVTKVAKDNQEYILAGETSESTSGGSSSKSRSR